MEPNIFYNGVRYVPEGAEQASSIPGWLVIVGIIFGVLFALWLIFLWLGPIYNVWASRKEGEANLAKAKFDEQIQVAEANSRLAAAEANKKAEVVEAEAFAESIKTIGEALNSNRDYLHWQWIKMMEDRDGDTVYVPTEASMPILEATRRIRPDVPV